MTEQIIKIVQLNKSFANEHVLNDINFSVQSGEIVGLIGPSGAGKSTIINITLGMELADSGTATVFDQPMPNRKLLGKIGYMAQTDALYESLTGFENLRFFGQMKGLKKTVIDSEINRVAQVVDLTPDLSKKVSGYSGGMKRRLSLAIALLGNPKLLVLDEPTVGIDPALRRQIWQELRRVSATGSAILITTHVMDEAELTDKVALLLGGSIISFDTPKKLKEDAQVSTIEDVFLKAEGIQL